MQLGPGSDFLEVREWVKSMTGSSVLPGQGCDEVVFSTASRFSFCYQPPDHSPGWEALQNNTQTSNMHPYGWKGCKGFSLSSTQDRPCQILTNKKRLQEVNLYCHLCAVWREHTVWSVMIDWHEKLFPSLSAFSGCSWTCSDNTPSITNILKPRAGECLKPQPYNVMKNTHSCSNNHIII